jgi:hypothetical protein
VKIDWILPAFLFAVTARAPNDAELAESPYDRVGATEARLGISISNFFL